MITVALLDDQPIFLKALELAFERVSGIVVAAKATSTSEMPRLAANGDPDVLIIDPTMQGTPYATIASVAKAARTKVLALSAGGVEVAVQALEAGASGFLHKGCCVEELERSVKAVAAGETVLSPWLATGVINALRDVTLRKRASEAIRLSIRERQVVRYLLRGKTNKEIAAQLSLSEKTIKHYMSSIMQKMNARNRTEVLLAAQKLDMGECSGRESLST